MLESYKELISAKSEIKMLKKQLEKSKPIVHAHWKKVNEWTHVCSNCGVKAAIVSDEYDYMEDLSDYCHSCGAQMDEVTECSK